MSNVTNRQLPYSQGSAGWPTTTNAAQPTTQPWPTVRMPTVPPAATEILRDAVFHIDAAEHQCSGANPKTVRNLGWGGSVLNARCGSTTVADTNDPLFLPFYGTPYAYLPGGFPNYLTTPNAAPIKLKGSFTTISDVELSSYEPGTSYGLVCKGDGASQRSYSVFINPSGYMVLVVSANGTSNAWETGATAPINVPAGVRVQIKTVFTADDGSGGKSVSFYKSLDQGETWAMIGTTLTSVGTVALYSASNSVLYVGAVSGGSQAVGKIYRTSIINEVGTLVFDADTSVLTSGSQTTFTEKSSNAATVTINRATSGRKSAAVVAPVWLFGTDDYMSALKHSMLDFNQGSSFTVVTASRHWPSNANQWIIGNSFNTPGWFVAYSNVGGVLGSLRGTSNSGGNPQSVPLVFRLQRSVDRRTLVEDTHVAKDATPGGVDSLVRMQIGHDQGGSYAYADMEFMAAAIFRRALSEDEYTTLTDYFTRKYA